MQTARETIERIQEIANANQANEAVRVQQVPDLKIGECYRQGDLYVFKVADDHPVGKELDRMNVLHTRPWYPLEQVLRELPDYINNPNPKSPVEKLRLHVKKTSIGYKNHIRHPLPPHGYITAGSHRCKVTDKVDLYLAALRLWLKVLEGER